MLVVFFTFATLCFIFRDFLKDRANLKVKISESIRKEHGQTKVEGLTISVWNKGKRTARIQQIGILLSQSEEKIMGGGLDWVLSENDKPIHRDWYFNSNPKYFGDLESYINKGGQYIAFAEDDNGKRYYSCSKIEKFKITGRF